MCTGFFGYFIQFNLLMIKNYFLTSLRSLLKNKSVSAINIIGLTIGMAAFLMMVQFVVYELSYDNFHISKTNIYRVESKFSQNGIVTDDWATSSGGYGPAMQREFPGIKKFARIYLQSSERIVSTGDIKHREKNVYFADASMLEVFSFELKKGNRATALLEPNSVILSESAAKKYFGTDDPIGKTLKLSNSRSKYECSVTGVFRDVPSNSHITFDMLISWTTMSSQWKGVDEFWYQHSAYTYVLLEPGTDISQIENRFPALAEKYKTMDAMKNHSWGVNLVPLKDIHLNPLKGNEREIKGSRATVSILAVAAIVTLIIAFVNYVNLATARALERAKEVSIRKTAGANKRMLIAQFLLESCIINAVSLVFATLVSWMLHPYFQELTSTPMDFFLNFNGANLLILLVIFVTLALIAGLYPAFVLASFDPIVALKGKITRHGRGKLIRKTLVVFQFAVSITLIAIAIVVSQQVKFMQGKATGINTAQVLVLKIPGRTDGFNEKLETLRHRLHDLSPVTSVTISSSVAGYEVAMNLANRRAEANPDETNLFEMLRTDPEFIATFELELLNGRNFSRDIPTDAQAIIVNEEAAKLLGYNTAEQALNREVFLETSDKKFTIIAVAKNYHQTSLRDDYKPIMFFTSPDFGWIPYSYISLKVNSTDLSKTLSLVQEQWNSTFPESSFDYFFLNDHIDQQYKNDVAFGKLINLFCILIIVIACLGLLGLAAYETILRRREVGIRKTLGATVPQLLFLLSREVVMLLTIAFMFSLPFAYMIAESWLTNYSFRMEVGMWMLIFPLLILVPIALLTVTSQTLKAALTNPVESLRHE